MPAVIFRKGLNLKDAVSGALSEDYHSALVDEMIKTKFRRVTGRLTIHLAREFGFCYGVGRAVDYAYQTRARFPERTVYLTGEIIHNPHVNHKLRNAGIRFLSDPETKVEELGPASVIILPAFGVRVEDLLTYDRLGCTIVDTTCGSVLNVWKNVTQYAQDGFTALIHGKVHHEETQATASQALRFPGGRYLIVLDREEATAVCEYIRRGGDHHEFMTRFHHAASPDFDPTKDLQRIGLANQTTMLMTESLAIGELLREAMTDRYGKEMLGAHYRAFDTICSATQDRQDAVNELLTDRQLDLMLVVGGYNSSNTRNLAKICDKQLRTFHIADADELLSRTTIRHRPITASLESSETMTGSDWLPSQGPLSVGLTAGASTPNNIVGQVVDRLERFTAEPAKP